MESKPNVKIQNKRINKELKMLKNLNMLFGKIEKDDGILIRIEIQANMIKSQFLNSDIEKLYFEVFLTEKFPFQPPQVYGKSKIVYPTIDDKRDVLEEVIKKEWAPSMTIYETVQLIPEFVSEILLQMTQNEKIRSIGKWHLGQFYNVNDWGVGLFKVREEKETMDGVSYYDRYIAVGENSFFLFEPVGKRNKLISVATLCSLEKIIRNLDMPEYVTFVWRKIEGTDNRPSGSNEQWILKVEVQNTVEGINLIVKYLKMLEVSVQKKYEKKRKILASEVNEKAIKNTDVSSLMKQVSDAEEELKVNVTNKSVKNLMNLYQKAIEYYSALDNKGFEDFLMRMTNLFKRDDIQKALAQPEEEVKAEEMPKPVVNQDNLKETQEQQHQILISDGNEEKDEVLDA